LCLVVDRLSAGYLAASGTTWMQTPAFDRLAAQSLCFDRAMAESPTLDRFYDSIWGGVPGWYAEQYATQPIERSLPALYRTRGAGAWLVTDDSAVAAHRLASSFDEIVCLPAAEASEQAASWDETHLGAFFAAAVETLSNRQPPGLVWLHAGALGRSWNSPQPLRDQYNAPDDPQASTCVQPPSLLLDSDRDPDMLLSLRHAYAGEISVLDLCLDFLLSAVDASPWRDSLLCVTSPRGYPLGEHDIVGEAGTALYHELLRVPLMFRAAGRFQYGRRSSSLVQPADQFEILRTWPARGSGPVGDASVPDAWSPAGEGALLAEWRQGLAPTRELAIAGLKSREIALATPAWFVRAQAPISPEGNDGSTVSGQSADRRKIELFVEPDDYFQVNEVSDRCQEIVEEFEKLTSLVDEASLHGAPLRTELPASLVSEANGSGQ
jgi:hypothetical protein